MSFQMKSNRLLEIISLLFLSKALAKSGAVIPVRSAEKVEVATNRNCPSKFRGTPRAVSLPTDSSVSAGSLTTKRVVRIQLIAQTG